MEITGVSTTSDIDTSSSTGGTELDQTAFLSLLTTQLQNQDPSNPQDSSEFVAQLAQFSTLEQLIAQNESLSMLYVVASSLNNASMTQLLGTEVTATSDSFSYDGENAAELTFDLDGDAASGSVTIYDADGNAVYVESLDAMSSGENTYTWDGTDNDGNAMEAGTYTFTITAQDSDGETVSAVELLHGEIDGMTFESGSPQPTIGDIIIDLGDILDVGTTDD